MFATVFALMFGLVFGGTGEVGSVADSTTVSVEACDGREDASDCFWDASEMGNGSGVDFHDIGGVAYYACDGEDSAGEAGCFWNAAEQGNGQGSSFTYVKATDTYHYWK